MAHRSRSTLLALPAIPAILLLPLAGGCASSIHRATHGGVQVLSLREEYVNVHFVRTRAGAILVDAGFERSAEKIERRLVNEGVDPATIRAVVLTHGHADHAGGAAWFRRRWGARIIAGRRDRPLLSQGTSGKLCRVDGDEKSTRVAEAERYSPPQVDVWVDDAMDLQPLSGVPGTVHPIPGHTEGSLVLVIGEIAFVGDMFRGAVIGSSAETHYFMCDLADNLADIRGLLAAHPAVHTFYVGHFGPVSREALQSYVQDRMGTEASRK